jgi:hypothetical protein
MPETFLTSFSHSHFTQSSDLTPLQVQMDGLVSAFAERAVDGYAFLGVLSGTGGNRAIQLGALRFAQPVASLMPRVLAPISQMTARVAGFGAEAMLFEAVPRKAKVVLGNAELSSLNLHGEAGLIHGIAHSGISLLGFRVAGVVSANLNSVAQSLAQSVSIVSFHQISALLGVSDASRDSLAQQLVDAKGTVLQLWAGMSMLHQLTPTTSQRNVVKDLEIQKHSTQPTSRRTSGDLLNPLAAGAELTASFGAEPPTLADYASLSVRGPKNRKKIPPSGIKSFESLVPENQTEASNLRNKELIRAIELERTLLVKDPSLKKIESLPEKISYLEQKLLKCKSEIDALNHQDLPHLEHFPKFLRLYSLSTAYELEIACLRTLHGTPTKNRAEMVTQFGEAEKRALKKRDFIGALFNRHRAEVLQKSIMAETIDGDIPSSTETSPSDSSSKSKSRTGGTHLGVFLAAGTSTCLGLERIASAMFENGVRAGETTGPAGLLFLAGMTLLFGTMIKSRNNGRQEKSRGISVDETPERREVLFSWESSIDYNLETEKLTAEIRNLRQELRDPYKITLKKLKTYLFKLEEWSPETHELAQEAQAIIPLFFDDAHAMLPPLKNLLKTAIVQKTAFEAFEIMANNLPVGHSVIYKGAKALRKIFSDSETIQEIREAALNTYRSVIGKKIRWQDAESVQEAKELRESVSGLNTKNPNLEFKILDLYQYIQSFGQLSDAEVSEGISLFGTWIQQNIDFIYLSTKEKTLFPHLLKAYLRMGQKFPQHPMHPVLGEWLHLFTWDLASKEMPEEIRSETERLIHAIQTLSETSTRLENEVGTTASTGSTVAAALVFGSALLYASEALAAPGIKWFRENQPLERIWVGTQQVFNNTISWLSEIPGGKWIALGLGALTLIGVGLKIKRRFSNDQADKKADEDLLPEVIQPPLHRGPIPHSLRHWAAYSSRPSETNLETQENPETIRQVTDSSAELTPRPAIQQPLPSVERAREPSRTPETTPIPRGEEPISFPYDVEISVGNELSANRQMDPEILGQKMNQLTHYYLILRQSLRKHLSDPTQFIVDPKMLEDFSNLAKVIEVFNRFIPHLTDDSGRIDSVRSILSEILTEFGNRKINVPNFPNIQEKVTQALDNISSLLKSSTVSTEDPGNTNGGPASPVVAAMIIGPSVFLALEGIARATIPGAVSEGTFSPAKIILSAAAGVVIGGLFDLIGGPKVERLLARLHTSSKVSETDRTKVLKELFELSKKRPERFKEADLNELKGLMADGEVWAAELLLSLHRTLMQTQNFLSLAKMDSIHSASHLFTRHAKEKPEVWVPLFLELASLGALTYENYLEQSLTEVPLRKQVVDAHLNGNIAATRIFNRAWRNAKNLSQAKLLYDELKSRLSDPEVQSNAPLVAQLVYQMFEETSRGILVSHSDQKPVEALINAIHHENFKKLTEVKDLQTIVQAALRVAENEPLSRGRFPSIVDAILEHPVFSNFSRPEIFREVLNALPLLLSYEGSPLPLVHDTLDAIIHHSTFNQPEQARVLLTEIESIYSQTFEKMADRRVTPALKRPELRQHYEQSKAQARVEVNKDKQALIAYLHENPKFANLIRSSSPGGNTELQGRASSGFVNRGRQ